MIIPFFQSSQLPQWSNNIILTLQMAAGGSAVLPVMQLVGQRKTRTSLLLSIKQSSRELIAVNLVHQRHRILVMLL